MRLSLTGRYLTPLFYRVPLALRMVVGGLLLGAVAWYVLDAVQTRALRNIYEEEFRGRLTEQAQRDRLRFDKAIRDHFHLLGLIAEQADARVYFRGKTVQLPDWNQPSPQGVAPRLERRMPAWMPRRALMRSFPAPDILLTLDSLDRVRDIFLDIPDDPPPLLLTPLSRILRASERESLIVRIGQRPYVVATARVDDGAGARLGSLVSLSEINSRFLLQAQGTFKGAETVVALFTGQPLAALATSDGERLPLGTLFDDATREFMVTGKAFFDYDSSEIHLTFASLLSRQRFAELMGPVLQLERNQRTILGATMVSLFVVLLALLSHRLRRLIGRVERFTQAVFGVVPVTNGNRDELAILETRFSRLVAEVQASRQALEKQAEEKFKLSARQMEIQVENERLHLLQSVTDAVGIGVLRLTDGGPVPLTRRMEEFIAACGPADLFTIEGDDGDLALASAKGRDRTFHLTRISAAGSLLILVQDVTEQRRTEQELWNLALYPSQNPMPVLRLGEEGVVLHANPAASSLLRRWERQVGEKLPEPWCSDAAAILRSLTPTEREVTVGERILSLTFMPIPQAGYLNVYGQDITARKRAEQALLRANDDLENSVAQRTTELREEIRLRRWNEDALLTAKEQAELANRAKTEFLANMSHELRTPLNAIIGFSEMMLAEVFGALGNDQYKDYALDIHNSGRHLLDIINDILDVSKIEVGQMELALETVPVASLVEAALRLVRERAHRAGLSLKTAIAPSLPDLRVDPRRAKQILLNLLSNSVKFTPPDGQITVGAWQEGTEVVLAVADTGIGMTEQEVTLALRPFGQVDSQLARKYEGTGLGLPLAKSLAELHGGTLKVESTRSEGTTVTVRLPIEGPPEPVS